MGIMYSVADTKGVLNMGGFVNGILYCVADTKGDLRLRRYNRGNIVSCRGYQGCSMGGGVIVTGILYRVADTKAVLREEGVLLRVYCILSRIPRVV